jgi:hypothetical protein
MMATTIMSSMSVKPLVFVLRRFVMSERHSSCRFGEGSLLQFTRAPPRFYPRALLKSCRPRRKSASAALRSRYWPS